MLVKLGHTAMEAEDGSIALQLYEESLNKQKPFAAIFMDSVMPIMDGELLCSYLYSLPPVICFFEPT